MGSEATSGINQEGFPGQSQAGTWYMSQGPSQPGQDLSVHRWWCSASPRLALSRACAIPSAMGPIPARSLAPQSCPHSPEGVSGLFALKASVPQS